MPKLIHTLTLPFFTGFYDSIHSSIIDDAVSDVLNGQDNEGNIDYDNQKYLSYEAMRSVEDTYCRKYTESYIEHCNLPPEFRDAIQFESMDSPKEYNFMTDRIFCTITPSLIVYLRQAVQDTDLDALIHKNHSDGSGFFSYYHNTLAAWEGTDLLEWDHNQLGTLFECWVIHCSDMPTEEYCEGEYNIREWDIIDELQSDLHSHVLAADHLYPNPDNIATDDDETT